MLWSLRGKNRRKSTPGVGGAGLAQTAIGVGSGLEARDKSCVVRWGYWRRWRELAVRVFAWVVLGPCLSCRFYRRWRLPFGGRWPGWRERGGGVDVEFFPPDTRNLTQRSLRSERMERNSRCKNVVPRLRDTLTRGLLTPRSPGTRLRVDFGLGAVVILGVAILRTEPNGFLVRFGKEISSAGRG